MAIILIGGDRRILRLGRIIAAIGKASQRHGRGQQGRAPVEPQGDVALQVNGIAGIAAGRDIDRPAAALRSKGDRPVDRRAVDMAAIALRAEIADIDDALRQGAAESGQCRQHGYAGGTFQQETAIERSFHLPLDPRFP